MNKFLTIIFFLVFTSAHAGGHISKKQKQETIQCLCHNSATANLPAYKHETISYTNLTQPTNRELKITEVAL